MPGPTSAHSGLPGGLNNQVVHANTTLNAFVGGRQKAWMLNAAPVQPSPRPPPRAQLAQQPTLQLSKTPTNVLPSPAPSDEPSPAVSNPRDRDSPYSPASSVMPAGQRQDTGQAPAVQSSALANPPLHHNDATPADAEVVAGEPARPPTTENSTAGMPLQSLQSPLAMAPPTLPHAPQPGPVANASGSSGHVAIELERAFQSAMATAAGEQPNKRRRIECAEQCPFELLRQC
ncbi:hypothetical protein VPNG_08424 [Cytospora leucostoma]|uniref:Uncharacterized protein n=1 Tax=Cytospora leucostoma TaxID=1230097 RepID=A0A423W632_9PEZI|nr:hypothetical protein VPNG_08424 [Cytospora leucostoma]